MRNEGFTQGEALINTIYFKTSYKSSVKLTVSPNEIEENSRNSWMRERGMNLMDRREVKLSINKSF